MDKLIISPAPHIHSGDSVSKNMTGVIVALVPALLVGFYFFGLGALIVTLIAVFSSVLFEYLIQRYLLKEESSIMDGSAALTGLLLAMNLPSNLPVWMIIVGSLVAIGIGKMSFGGLGNNPFNPALVGRVFLLISFPVDMTLWPLPKPVWTMVDAVTGPTSLGVLKEGVAKGDTVSQLASQLPSLQDLFIGGVGGSLGEVSAAALILGGLYMIFRKIITWHIPVSFIATVAIFTGIMWQVNPEQYINPMFHLLAGGLMLGAIFMATDMVTSPMTYKGW